MDRKAWIVVTLCAIGLAVNFWYAQKHAQTQAEAARIAAEQKAKEAPASPQPADLPQNKEPAIAGQTPGTTPAAPVMTALPEETWELKKGSVTWHFTTRGGGIARALLAANDQTTLNAHAREPVGALRREAAGIDNVPYAIVEKTDRTVVFEGTTADGIRVRKAYALSEGEKADDHLVTLSLTLTNTGTAPYRSEEFYLFTGAAASSRPDEILHPSYFWNDAGNANHTATTGFDGGWFGSEKLEMRHSFSDLRYGGVMSRFYTHIISHAGDGKPGKLWATRFLVDHSQDEFKELDAAQKDYAINCALGLPPVDLAPGASQSESFDIYMGPKEYARLRDLGKQRHFIMFYGWFTWISQILNNTMRWLHDLSGNWGIAIMLLTILIRTVLWPLQAKAQYSMKRMGLLAPLMKELQEKYKDDPQKQQAEVMRLYKDYGVNPVGGCLPMLIQIPIFFAFYGVLQNAAELRGQGFLWVKDLSLPDTIHTLRFPFSLPLMGDDFDINPLPLIMGLTMILQMKLTPQPQSMDKTQKYMLTFMPLIFLFISYNFASALALYWATQNIYVIFQTRIMKMYQKEPVLEKVDRSAPKGPPPQNPFFNPMNPRHKDKKSKNRPPKLGG